MVALRDSTRRHAYLPVPKCLVVLVLLTTLLVTPTANPQQPAHKPVVQAIDIGMVALLASPEKYQGEVIRTIGFLCIEFEGDALYLHEEDYRYGLRGDSFALRLADSQRTRLKPESLGYVIIEATVEAHPPEGFGGVLGNITRSDAWPVNRGPVPRK